MTLSGIITVLHAFAGDGSEGTGPSSLIQGSDGNLYGTTFNGGIFSPVCFSSGCGTVFKMTITGTVTVLHAIDGSGSGKTWTPTR